MLQFLHLNEITETTFGTFVESARDLEGRFRLVGLSQCWGENFSVEVVGWHRDWANTLYFCGVETLEACNWLNEFSGWAGLSV